MSTLITITFASRNVNAQTPINAIEIDGKTYIVAGHPAKRQAAQSFIQALRPTMRMVNRANNVVTVAIDGYVSQPWIETTSKNVVIPATMAPAGTIDGLSVYYINGCGQFFFSNGQKATPEQVARYKKA